MGERGTITATLRDATGNPGPLGLMAFGLTTVLLNVHNAGLIPLSGIILAMGVFYGGIAQVIAGIMEWKKNSTFGMTAFLSYGFFWLTFVGIFAFPKWIGSSALDLGATSTALGYYLLAWGLFTGLMFVGTLRINRSLQTVFLSLTVLFVLLALGEWTGNATITKIAGWEGIFVGL
ncbi:MAG: acetate uptake transporter, partial [Actinomycetes bacterium]